MAFTVTTRGIGPAIVLGGIRRIAISATLGLLAEGRRIASASRYLLGGGEGEAPLPVGSQIPPFVFSMVAAPLSV